MDQDHPSELGGQEVEIVARQSSVWRILQRAEAEGDEAEGDRVPKPQGKGERNAEAERVREAKAGDRKAGRCPEAKPQETSAIVLRRGNGRQVPGESRAEGEAKTVLGVAEAQSEKQGTQGAQPVPSQ